MGRGEAEIAPYPKWVKGVVVKNEEEEQAVLEDRAIFREIKSAQGDTREIVGVTPRPEPEPEAPKGRRGR